MYTDWSNGLLGGESVWACSDHAPPIPGWFKTTRRPIPRRNGPPVFQQLDASLRVGLSREELDTLLTPVFTPVGTDDGEGVDEYERRLFGEPWPPVSEPPTFREAIDRDIRRVALGLTAPAPLVYEPPILYTHDPDVTLTQVMGEALSKAWAEKLDRDILGDADPAAPTDRG